MEKMVVVIRCRLDPALKERVERLAKRRNSRPSRLLREALADFLDRAESRGSTLGDSRALVRAGGGRARIVADGRDRSDVGWYSASGIAGRLDGVVRGPVE